MLIFKGSLYRISSLFIIAYYTGFHSNLRFTITKSDSKTGKWAKNFYTAF